MKKLHIFSLLLGSFFLYQVLISNPTQIRYFAYQDVRIIHDWGRIKVKMESTHKKHDSNISIVRNPYSINLFVTHNLEKNVWQN